MSSVALSRRDLVRILAGAAAIALLPGCGGATPTAVAVKGGAAAAGEHADFGEFWTKSGGDDLLKGKTIQAVFDAIPNRPVAFTLKDTFLRCIDEGCPGGIHMAGSGCLYDKAAEDLKGKITGIWTHEGCGAAKLYVESKKIQTDSPDSVADAEAKKLADKLGIPYFGRIPASQMQRPAIMHDARAIYYDGTGKFEPTQVNGLPKGFMVSRKVISDPAYAKAEVDVAIGIAMGDHGFGTYFSGKTPLYVCCVGGLDGASVPTQVLAEEMMAVAGKIPNVEIQTLLGGREATESAKPVVKAGDPIASPPQAHGDGHASGGHGKLAPSFGPTYVVKDKVVNLADPGGRRYVRFSVAIEFAPHGDAHAAAVISYEEAWSRLVSYHRAPDLYQEVTGGGPDPEKAFQASIKKYVPAIEDLVTSVMASKVYDDLATAALRDTVKQEIADRLARLLEGTDFHVTNVYFTDMVFI